jgi:hypothetical protein
MIARTDNFSTITNLQGDEILSNGARKEIQFKARVKVKIFVWLMILFLNYMNTMPPLLPNHQYIYLPIVAAIFRGSFRGVGVSR